MNITSKHVLVFTSSKYKENRLVKRYCTINANNIEVIIHNFRKYTKKRRSVPLLYLSKYESAGRRWWPSSTHLSTNRCMFKMVKIVFVNTVLHYRVIQYCNNDASRLITVSGDDCECEDGFSTEIIKRKDLPTDLSPTENFPWAMWWSS